MFCLPVSSFRHFLSSKVFSFLTSRYSIFSPLVSSSSRLCFCLHATLLLHTIFPPLFLVSRNFPPLCNLLLLVLLVLPSLGLHAMQTLVLALASRRCSSLPSRSFPLCYHLIHIFVSLCVSFLFVLLASLSSRRRLFPSHSFSPPYTPPCLPACLPASTHVVPSASYLLVLNFPTNPYALPAVFPPSM